MENSFGFVVRYNFLAGLDEIAPVLSEEARGYFTRTGFVIYDSAQKAQAEARRRNERFIQKK